MIRAGVGFKQLLEEVEGSQQHLIVGLGQYMHNLKRNENSKWNVLLNQVTYFFFLLSNVLFKSNEHFFYSNINLLVLHF